MKNQSFNKLTTPYEKNMDRSLSWADYPRPSMVRDSYLCLNGRWDFAISKEEAVSEFKEKILVPFPPESRLSEIERGIEKGKLLHYRRVFTLPEEMVGKRILLHFGAVDTICQVFLNGERVGSHEGGYLPFEIDVTRYIKKGENQLYVRVRDDLDAAYPYGKQTRKRGGMWYTPVSGIWQTVWLEAVADKYVQKLEVIQGQNEVTIRVKGGEEKKIITLAGEEPIEFYGESVTISPKEKHQWTPDYPYLYHFTLECGEDKVKSYFALREIAVKTVNGIPRLTLNGEPYLFNGLLDQGYFPDGIFLPATSEGYRKDILQAKSCGFNMLRKHIKVEPEIFYYLCDSLGMVVFQDMVNNSSYSFIIDTALPTVGFKRLPILFRHKKKRVREIFEKEMYGTMEHLGFFPSVLYYTVFNEGWGQFCADKMYRKAKNFAPDRIIDATSGWFYRTESDVDSRHVYFKPVKLGKTDSRPVVISEFGGYSHRVKDHIFGEDEYGYSSFVSREEFSEAFERLYGEELLPQIKEGICALVYTQISDVEDETNGILTYDRAVMKLNPDRTKALMKKLYDEIK